jgi:hypothetical protein
MSPEPEPRNDLAIKPFTNGQAQSTQMKMLTSLMPGLTHMIQNIYGRPNATGSGGAVPQVVFSECAIRLSKLLSVMNLSGGTLADNGISHLMLGIPLNIDMSNTVSRLRMHPSRRDITHYLGRALPEPHDQYALTPTDHAIVLAGVASVYSLLGMQRKKAMIMREFISVLIPVFQQAKVAGAAEAGIHPSAGLSALAVARGTSEWELESGIEGFLNVICQAYDIPESNWTKSIGDELLQDDADGDETKAKPLPGQLVGNFVLRAFGNINIKADVLRTCIQLCEALSDFRGVLHYSSALLRTAGPGIAPSAETSDVLVNLAREEQMQLANNIFKTVEMAKVAGQPSIEAEYWDEFLVRGFYLLEPAVGLILRPRKRADLGKVKTKTPQQRDPFIHNPFLDKSNANAPKNLLSANEEREFVVLLQNPYEFEVEIESLRLAADVFDLDIIKSNFILKPYRTQSFSLPGKIATDGFINITGCIIKVKGCRERLFPIFSDPWTPEADTKVKNIGLGISGRIQSGRDSDISMRYSGNELNKRSFPIPASIPLNIISEQPSLVIDASSVSQNSLMLLEGERATITVSVKNVSTVPADFILVSFRDTASEAMQDAINQKGIHPADMYEIEYQMAKLPIISMAADQPTSIAAQSSATFTFHILAKAGLSSASIQFDYANLSSPHTINEDSFFTRKITFPLSVTVNASILVHRMEVVSLSGDFAWQITSKEVEAQSNDGSFGNEGATFAKMSSALRLTKDAEEHCLLLLDLRNSWPSPLNTNIQVRPVSSDKDDADPIDSTTLFTSVDQIQPGQISRQILLIPKIYIAEPHRRIKPLSPAHQRQFVVSTDRISPETELLSRECFWFREALLSHLTGSWSLEGVPAKRTGSIDLRAVRLSARMLDNLRLPDVGINLSAHGSNVKQLGNTRFSAAADSFLAVRTRLRNRSPQTIYPLLRLRPTLADQPREIALDLSKRFAWSGVLQRTLPALRPGGEISVELSIRALCSGEYEVGASVEEIKFAEGAGGTLLSQESRQRQEGKSEFELDDFVREVGRRTWTAGSPCRIHVEDQEVESD